MKEIIIGGRLVVVPKGYIQAEAAYTEDEITIFNALPSGQTKEDVRLAILEKREEFYQLYLAGKVELPENSLPKKLNLWQRIVLYFKAHV